MGILMNSKQYKVVADYRLQQDNLLWQTPVLSITAQAFLFNLSLADDISPVFSLIAALLSAIISIASIQLIYKHRALELHCSILLEKFETATTRYTPIHAQPDLTDIIRDQVSRTPLFGLFSQTVQTYVLRVLNASSFNLWVGILLLISLASYIILVLKILGLLCALFPSGG